MKKQNILILFIAIMTTINTFALKPSRDYLYKPDSLKMKFKEFKYNTKDGAIINTWVIKPKSVTENNKKVIIIAQTDAGNMSYLLYHAYSLSYKGYNVVMFDYRGFGESSDFKMNSEQLYYDEFVIDLKTVLCKTKEMFSNKKVGVLAFSMGTIITNFLVKNEKVDFLILEGIIPNLNTFIVQIKDKKGKDIILPKSAKKYNKNFKKNLDKINKVVIFHGLSDSFSNVSLFQNNNSSKIIIVEFNGGHLQGFFKLGKKFFGDVYIESFENHI